MLILRLRCEVPRCLRILELIKCELLAVLRGEGWALYPSKPLHTKICRHGGDFAHHRRSLLSEILSLFGTGMPPTPILQSPIGHTSPSPQNTEAGALGAAIIAGVGSQTFASYQEGVDAMVRLDRTFEPDVGMHQRYQQRFEKYRQLGPLMRPYLQDLSTPDV